jgi:cob(I)alamin adenosyltransferase
MTKIYTKTGDKGETGLIGGKRVFKSVSRIEAYGDVDELNAVLGFGISLLTKKHEEIEKILVKIQEELFIIGAELATPSDYHGKKSIPKIQEEHVEWLEKQIDAFQEKLPSLQHFILPSGSQAGAWFHFARTVCRRAERHVVRLSQEEEIQEAVLHYLNRLSDFLFVLARVVNHQENMLEIPWIPKPC